MCYDNEGVYVDTYGKITKNVVLQWGELPTSVAYIGTGQIMGWGNKAIEIRLVLSVENQLTQNKWADCIIFACVMMQEMLFFYFSMLSLLLPLTDP